MKRCHRHPRIVLLGSAALLAGLCAGGQARAGNSDAPAAQALFNEAKKLMTEGRWAEACPKLEDSQRLDPGIGTEFNLANCYERTGRTASAWATFLNVAGSAKAAGQGARERVARDRAAALEPKLAKLVITVRATDASNLKVTRNNLEVGRSQWGTPIPIDTGDHRIAASAPGKKTWERQVRVPFDGTTVSVEIPALQEAPRPIVATAPPETNATSTPVSPPDSEPLHPGRGQRIAGGVIGAVGLVGIGVGTVFGFASRSKRDESNEGHCNAENRCDETGLQLREDAIRNGTYSTVAFATGGAALLGGIILFATAPSGKSSQTGVQASPMVAGAGRSMGVQLQATW